jgi:hypothetical protein
MVSSALQFFFSSKPNAFFQSIAVIFFFGKAEFIPLKETS